MASMPCRYSRISEVDTTLKHNIAQLGAPWCWLGRLRMQSLRDAVVEVLRNNEKQIGTYSQADLNTAVESAVDQVLSPYRNRLTLMAYGLLLGSVGVNAYLVTLFSRIPAMSAFIATLGGTLAGALGFQVLARLQAWAKQLSSNGGSLKIEEIPFDALALEIWRRSQQMKSDLPRDGRNIRKDSWLQLHARFEKALVLEHDIGCEAIADALIDHRQSFGEVPLDFWLCREFYRNLKHQFGDDPSIDKIKSIFRETAPIHQLPLVELDRLADQVLRKD